VLAGTSTAITPPNLAHSGINHEKSPLNIINLSKNKRTSFIIGALDMTSNGETNSALLSQPQTLAGICDIIPVTLFVPISKAHIFAHHTKPSYIDRMKDLKNRDLVLGQSPEKEKEGRLKIVYMPHEEYLKYFAKDKDGNYSGTEPERTWTDAELNEAFGMYQPPAE
jgi:hypothetical protein